MPPIFFSLLPLLLECGDFLLRQNIEGSVLAHLLDLIQSLDSGLNGLEVGEHAAEPALVDIVHTAALRLFLDRILRLLLGTDKEDGAAVCGDVHNCLVGIVHHAHGLLQINDVNAVAFRVDVRRHLGVPASGLMTEVNTRLE